MRKVYRCTEMVQRAITKVVAASVGDISLDESSFSGPLSPHLPGGDKGAISAGKMFDPQTCEVMASSQEVTLATHALTDLIRKRMPSHSESNQSKVKRMLPATPGRGLARCHSARSVDRHRIASNLASLDLSQGEK